MLSTGKSKKRRVGKEVRVSSESVATSSDVGSKNRAVGSGKVATVLTENIDPSLP
jgi:hypothetical protein